MAGQARKSPALFGRYRLILIWLRLACAGLASRLCFCLFLVIGCTDSGWQHGKVEPAVACFAFITLLLRTIVAIIAVITIAAVPVAIIAITTIIALLRTALFALFAFFAIFVEVIGIYRFILTGFGFAIFIAPFAAFAVIIAPFIALRAIFFLAAAEIGEHAEIMVSKLMIIFGLHPVAIQLGILCQLLVLFQHLSRITARTIIDAILVIVTVAIGILRAIIAPAATAAGLSVIHKD